MEVGGGRLRIQSWWRDKQVDQAAVISVRRVTKLHTISRAVSRSSRPMFNTMW
jgi:hypothetical protein